jgi:hypothetical protein
MNTPVGIASGSPGAKVKVTVTKNIKNGFRTITKVRNEIL